VDSNKKNVESKKTASIEERYNALVGRSSVKAKKYNDDAAQKPLTDAEAVERVMQVAQDAVDIERRKRNCAKLRTGGHTSIAGGSSSSAAAAAEEDFDLEDGESDGSEEAADNIVAQAVDLARLEQPVDDEDTGIAMGKSESKRLDDEVKNLLKEAENNVNCTFVVKTKDTVEQVCVMEGGGSRNKSKEGTKTSGMVVIDRTDKIKGSGCALQ